MYYVTVKQSPMYHQLTFEEFLEDKAVPSLINGNETNTRTYEVPWVTDAFRKEYSIPKLCDMLHDFNQKYERIREVDRHLLYKSFKIPKRSGGLRKIDAPNDELMECLRELKAMFETSFTGTKRRGAMYHTSAFAYIKGRSTLDSIKRHQQNESKWFAKLDLSNFFGSATMDFVMHQFGMVYPFSDVMMFPVGRLELERALELAFLDGGLPQGTPLSPLITNIMMIPIDFALTKKLRDYNGQKFVYTRYADDFLISSRYTFNVKEIENVVVNVLKDFNAPFSIKAQKTRYGSSSGSNWNLGVMLNKDNQITIGHKKKQQFKAMLSSYVMDHKNGLIWSREDIMEMYGLRSYYRMVEKEPIDALIAHIGEKFNVDIVKMIKADLRSKN